MRKYRKDGLKKTAYKHLFILSKEIKNGSSHLKRKYPLLASNNKTEIDGQECIN